MGRINPQRRAELSQRPVQKCGHDQVLQATRSGQDTWPALQCSSNGGGGNASGSCSGSGLACLEDAVILADKPFTHDLAVKQGMMPPVVLSLLQSRSLSPRAGRVVG